MLDPILPTTTAPYQPIRYNRTPKNNASLDRTTAGFSQSMVGTIPSDITAIAISRRKRPKTNATYHCYPAPRCRGLAATGPHPGRKYQEQSTGTVAL